MVDGVDHGRSLYAIPGHHNTFPHDGGGGVITFTFQTSPKLNKRAKKLKLQHLRDRGIKVSTRTKSSISAPANLGQKKGGRAIMEFLPNDILVYEIFNRLLGWDVLSQVCLVSRKWCRLTSVFVVSLSSSSAEWPKVSGIARLVTKCPQNKHESLLDSLGGPTIAAENALALLSARNRPLQELSLYVKPNIDDKRLCKLLKRFPYASQFRIRGSMSMEEKTITDGGIGFALKQHPSFAKSLCILVLQNTDVEDHGAKMIAMHCPRLQVVDLSYTTVGSEGVKDILQGCTELHTLRIQDIDIVGTGESFFRTIMASTTTTASPVCRNAFENQVKYLNLAGNASLENNALTLIGPCFPHVTCLKIHELPRITIQGLVTVVQSCPHLKYIKVSLGVETLQWAGSPWTVLGNIYEFSRAHSLQKTLSFLSKEPCFLKQMDQAFERETHKVSDDIEDEWDSDQDE